ncbi:MAG: ATP-binding cassette domain-containing protein, partial [Peptococcaceae bacterium]|nr:ATP-binding cassette domain-containing protein [Peptococcaceae bacterium]
GWISNALSQNLPVNDTPLDIVLSGKFASIGLWEKVTDADVKEAEAILEKLGIMHLKERTYNTLSQGEKQKVIIGRALISNPEIIIFDEACNGLDIFAKRDLYQIIEKLAEDNKSIFFVTHNTDEILPMFNKALLIKEGKVHSKGDLKEVIQQDNLQDFYGSEVDVFERNDRFFIFAK